MDIVENILFCLPLCIPLFVIAILIANVISTYQYNKELYEKSSYSQITKIPYWETMHDLGRKGEYKIYEILKNMEYEGARFLFNLYIPINNNKTTEIDVVMIATQGIFVFESKNYSGWIFGAETQRKWTQSLHIGYGNTQKEHFYNPIMQNEYHIKYLKKFLHTYKKIHSIIVFSDHCEFKDITRKPNSDACLIYRHQLYKTIEYIKSTSANVLTVPEIEFIYNKLYQYSQVSEDTKIQHIAQLHK